MTKIEFAFKFIFLIHVTQFIELQYSKNRYYTSGTKCGVYVYMYDWWGK